MRLRIKLSLILSTVAFVAILCISLFFSARAQDIIASQSIRSLKALANEIELRVEKVVEQNIERIQGVLSRTQLRLSLTKYLTEDDDASKTRIDKILKDALLSLHDFKSLIILNEAGHEITRVEKESLKLSGLLKEIKQTASEEIEVYLLKDDEGLLHFVITGEFELESSEAVRLVIIASTDTLYQVSVGSENIGETGDIILGLSDKDNNAYFVGKRRYASDQGSHDVIPAERTDVPIIQALKRNEIAMINAPDYREHPVFAVTRYVESLRLGIVVKIDRSDAFKPFVELMNSLTLLFLGTIVFLFLILLGVSRNITKPIEELRRALTIAGSGDLSHRIRAKGSDEIGEVARTFDEMTQRLTKVMASRDDLEREVRLREASELLLRKKNKELQEFAYVVSHDLKAPLRGISSVSEWMFEDYSQKLDDKGKKWLTQLKEASTRMGLLINGILEYSHAGRVKEDVQQISLKEVIDNARLLADPNKELNVYMDANLPAVWGEKVKIQQVFQNLISNAVKYTDKTDKCVKIECEELGNDWQLKFSDNGKGIDAKYLDKIFQLFQTIEDSRGTENTGVGLALVKKIIEMHHGRIWVTSEVGEGTAFYFTLPKKKL